MVQIDANAMYKIGYSMGGGARDNTIRNQTIGILGGMALEMIGGALNTRRELRSQSNATLANAQYETDQLGVVGQGPNAIDAAYSTQILNEQRKILKKANNQIAFGINTAKATANKLKAENTIKSHVEGLKYIDKQMSVWNGIYKETKFKYIYVRTFYQFKFRDCTQEFHKISTNILAMTAIFVIYYFFDFHL